MPTELEHDHHHTDHHHATPTSGAGADPHAHAEQAALLDLDAQLGNAFLTDLTGWAATQCAAPPRTIVDLGAGTGSGTLALARRFPTAHVVAVDSSPEMAEQLRNVARAADLADRIEVREADLDAAWPAPRGVDLVWAALSLHHAADPDRLLGDIRDALNPGGLLVVTEMDALPRVLPDDLGVGRLGLESRCHARLDELGWNAHPDWGPSLNRAGFTPVQQRTFEIVSAPEGLALADYARLLLTRIRSGLADRLDPDDLGTLDRLLSPDDPESLDHRTDLTPYSPRTAWLAHRPAAGKNEGEAHA